MHAPYLEHRAVDFVTLVFLVVVGHLETLAN